ncbi:MAG: recombination protein RecR [Aureispira sp.]|nr:recombination protein RecR [Aureispira sp.]
MNLSSKLLENTVQAFATLPGIGKKSALRIALQLLQTDGQEVQEFCEAILNMQKNIKFCKTCHNISDEEICSICNSVKRDKRLVCVVETIREVMAIENTQQYHGTYHVLGGVISPIEGIGPSDLNIDSLVGRIASGEVKELVMAVSPTIEGDTTIFYLAKQLKDYPVKISTISRGVSFGGELEYADEMTLGRSIVARIPYKK